MRTPSLFDTAPRCDGADYNPKVDQARLTKQLERVFCLMSDGVWRTLDQIALATGDPHASISAQLRNLRKPRFGGHTITKRRRGPAQHGLYEYRLSTAAGRCA
jgi:hypothetical protein